MDFEGVCFEWRRRQLLYFVYCSVPIVCYMCFARSLFVDMWAKQCTVWGGESGLAAEKFSSAELVTAWPRGTGRRRILGALRSLLTKMRVMNLGGGGGWQSWTWTSTSHTSLSDLLLWLWAQRWLSREGPRFVTANRCLNIFSYLAENGRRNGQKGWQRFCRWWLLLHLPQIFCVFPPAGSQAWDQPKDLSVPSTV